LLRVRMNMGLRFQTNTLTRTERGRMAINASSKWLRNRLLLALPSRNLPCRGRSTTGLSDPSPSAGGLGLAEHLTPQRSNGFASMVERIYTDSRRVVSGEARRSEPRIAPANNDPVSLFNLVRKAS